MKNVEIDIEERQTGGKGKARQLRRAGRVPGVLYGPQRETKSISVSAIEFDRKLAHLEGAHLVRLVSNATADLNDKMVLVRELQTHPVSGRPLHVDFYEVNLRERIRVSVALHFVGKAAGVVGGGILQPIQREVLVECLPTEIPDFIEVDVSPLGIHEAVHVGEITLPTGVTAVGDKTQPVVTVLPPTVEAKPAEAEAAATPEGGAAPAAPATPGEGGGKKGSEE